MQNMNLKIVYEQNCIAGLYKLVLINKVYIDL